MLLNLHHVDWRKLTLAAMIICFVAGIFILLRILFHWPLSFHWDYASHIAGTKIMLEEGCAPISELGGYSVCTNNAPGFYITSSVFARLFGVKGGVVLATFFYIVLYFCAAWRLIKKGRMNKLLTILSLFGTSFTFWWFFKVGRVLEISATIFAALFILSERKRDQVIFSSLAILHHPILIIPMLLVSKKRMSVIKSMMLTSPYLILVLMNSGFSKWPFMQSALYSANLLQALPFLLFVFPISKLLTILYSESIFCSVTGVCFLTNMPIVRNTFPESLIPLAIFQVYRQLINNEHYKTMAVLTLSSLLLFIGRQEYSIQRFGNPEFLLPMDQSQEWVDSQMQSTEGLFEYVCDDQYNYPSRMIMAAYAFTEYGLESTYSPFPEFIDDPPEAQSSIVCPT